MMVPTQTCVSVGCPLTVTEQLTALALSRPGPGAPVDEAAAWYERKATMLDHAAAEYGPGVSATARRAARDKAQAARAHAARLRECGDGPDEGRPQTCVSVRCDQCGDSPRGPEVEPHWPTESEALAALSDQGWEVDGPRLLCSACGAVLTCEAAGHQFTSWRRCRCEQLVPAHRPGPSGLCGMAFRYCLCCCLHESCPAPAPTTEAVA